MLVFHIGLPKTGTTLLQYRVLKRAPGIAFLHRKHGRAAMWLMRALRHHCQAGDAVGRLERPLLLAALARLGDGRPFVLSDESIALGMRRFWTGGAEGPERVARRLGALAAKAPPALLPCKVIVGIRRQDRWLASSYAHCADNPRSRGFCQDDFDLRLADIAAGRARQDALGWLDYARTRDLLAEALGADNVLMLPMERLTSDLRGTVRDLSRFLGGADLGRPKLTPDRPHYMRSVDGDAWMVKRTGNLLHLRPELARALRARFAESNRALALDRRLGFA
jgi:hypothetical protein